MSADDSREAPVLPPRNRRSFLLGTGIVVGVVASPLAFVLLYVLLMFPYLVETPFRIIVGWALHVKHMASRVGFEWTTLAIAIASFALAWFGAHRFLLWYVGERKPGTHWRTKHTLCAMLLLLLGAGAAISLSGIVHQSVWLGSERMVMVKATSKDRDQVLGRGEQIGMALRAYAEKEGKYPLSLDSLVDGKTIYPESLIYGTRGQPGEGFALLVAGRPRGTEERRAVAVSSEVPGVPHKIVVIRADGIAVLMDSWTLDEVIASAHADD